MRVEIDDDGDKAVSVTVTSGSDYSPDVMADLRARAVEAYRETLITRRAIAATEQQQRKG